MHHSRCDERPPPRAVPGRRPLERCLRGREYARRVPICRYVITELPVTRTFSCARQGPSMREVPRSRSAASFSRPTSSTDGDTHQPGRRRATERLNRRPCSAVPEPLQAAPLILTPPRTASSAFPNLCQVAEHTGRYRIVHLERGQREAAVEPSRCSKLSLQSSIGPLQADRGVAPRSGPPSAWSHPAGVTSQGDRRGGEGDGDDGEDDMTHDGSPSCPLRPPVGRFDTRHSWAKTGPREALTGRWTQRQTHGIPDPRTASRSKTKVGS